MGPFICKDPFGCINGTCGALPGDGEACTGDSRCAEGLGCDFTADGSFCVPLKDAGGSCQSDRTCKPGLYCEFSKNECTPVLPVGSPCNDGNECGPQGSCLPGSGGAFECAPIPLQGERCLFDCAAGLTCAPDVTNSACFAEVCLEL
ncbi:MAG: hypothetical protein IPK82_31090 [Polyangiaceae bacterium]|nr:hypothetical protein [Polyangiaceae bacterium]